eukprot:CAMPEP_0184486104 /NCGR_PEP_ID=MMETSP0113_2-20130426/7658_1 /TAXON_ID=91329 /ORGANISM="Norrisiella sphaerica, Strain BC52" /LENGTH=144 /DNA_ID=CAMNT_0026867843 /DNA_START=207 /DNA_END=641 /DNA_ORIENTATION=-
MIVRWKSVVGSLDIVGAAIFAVYIATEAPRLYLALVANLKEKVPHFAGFLFLSLLQLALTIYLTAFQKKRLPLEVILGILDCIFLILEFGYGCVTVQSVVQNKTARFDVELKALLDDDFSDADLDMTTPTPTRRTVPRILASPI